MKGKAKHVPGELRDVDVQFVSLVDKGANGRQFRIFKSEDGPGASGEERDEVRSFFEVIKRFFVGEGVVKAEGDQGGKALPSFAALIGQREMREDLAEARWLLSDVIEAILASDAANKTDLVAKAIDEYKTYVLGRIQQVGISKALEEVAVEKVGRKISAARLQRIKDALAALQSIVDEVETDENTEGEEEVKKEQLLELVKGAVGEAVAPLQERIAKLEGAGEEGKEELTAEAIAKMVKEAVSEAVQPLEARLEKVEKARGMSNAERIEAVEKSSGSSPWGGIFLG